jgi:fructokinase
LPGYKPILASAALELTHKVEKAQVFFFDRVSRGALHLAKAASDAGALVVFEPSGVGDPNLFQEAWALSHFVKYSHERLRDIADLDLSSSERDHVLLEVETLGKDGLRYRSRLPRCPSKGWQRVEAFEPLAFKDAGGAGDWCTAGILSCLARGGYKTFRAVSKDKLQNALNYGQALAAWNCAFEGARGGMYSVDKRTFKRQVQTILARKKDHTPMPDYHDTSINEALASLCPSCHEAQHKSSTVHSAKNKRRKSG